MLKNDTLKNGTSHIGLYGSVPRVKTLEIYHLKDRISFSREADFGQFRVISF